MNTLALALLTFASLASAPARAAESRTEAVVDEATREVLKPWIQAWEAGDAAAFSRLFAFPARTAGWTGRLGQAREFDGIRQSAWTEAAPAARTWEELSKEAAAYLQGYKTVEDVAISVTEATLEDGAALLKVRLDVRGRLPDGGRRTDRGDLSVRLEKSGDAWRIREIGDAGMETLAAERTVFEDATASAGLSKLEMHPRLEAIRRGGYAFVAADYDGDRYPDVLVGGYGPVALLRNRGDGTFEDVTKKAGLRGDTLVKAAVFADLDLDGRTDIAIQRFVEKAGEELLFYRNAGGGKFERPEADVKRRLRHDRAMSMAAADFDGDGRTDLYMGYPGVRDFTDPRLDVEGPVAHQAVYLNRGGWKFEELVPQGQAQLFTEQVRPHSALASDVDGDGRADLIVVDDRGNSSRLYLNLGDRFSTAGLMAGLHNEGWGMMAVAGDYDNDGRDDVYFTNIAFDSGRRLGLRQFQGNRLFRALGGGHFREVTELAGVGWAGEAPAGAEWLDYNADGHLDLYVTNGLWSADPDRDHGPAFVRELIGKKGAEAASFDDPARSNEVMAFLQKDGASFAGYQRHRLFRNGGDGTFTEVGYVAGADRTEDGYVAATADVDRDGKVDLLLRNADPASLERPHAPVVLLRNRGVEGQKTLAVYLSGRTGIDSFGARVTLTSAGKVQTREIRAVVGAVQSEQAAFFGLGRAEQADRLEVRWPSGRTDVYEGVPAGRILVREGEKSVDQLSMLPPEAR